MGILSRGIILTTGAVANASGPNVADDTTADNTGGVDPDLLSIANPPNVFDSAALEIEFTPSGNQVFFEYVFASDEYNEYANQTVNDTFGLFLNGQNLAVVNGQPVSINTVNGGNPFGTNPLVHDNIEVRGSPMKNGDCDKPLQRRADEAYRVNGTVESERLEAA